jgi:hypothetical protein
MELLRVGRRILPAATKLDTGISLLNLTRCTSFCFLCVLFEYHYKNAHYNRTRQKIVITDCELRVKGKLLQLNDERHARQLKLLTTEPD